MFYIVLFVILSTAFIISDASNGYYDRGTSSPFLDILAALMISLLIWLFIKFLKWAARKEFEHHSRITLTANINKKDTGTKDGSCVSEKRKNLSAKRPKKTGFLQSDEEDFD